MQVIKTNIRVILYRLVKYLGIALMGLFLIIMVLLLVVHSPPIQRKITSKVSDYLSNATGANIELQAIRFSLIGQISVEGISVDDQLGNSVLLANRISANPKLMHLISGNLRLWSASMSGLDLNLINDLDGLNIQFILDAFQSEEPTEHSRFLIKVDKVLLEDIQVAYQSKIDSLDLKVQLDILRWDHLEFTTNPNVVKLQKVLLQQAEVRALSYKAHAEMEKSSYPTESMELPDFDLGTGYHIEIADVELKDNLVSYHRGKVIKPQTFNTDHIDLKKIQLQLKDILLHKDSLSFNIYQCSVDHQGLPLQGGKAEIHANHNSLTAQISASSVESEVQAKLDATYHQWSDLLDELDRASVKFSISSEISPNDLSLLLASTPSTIPENWPYTRFKMEAAFNSGNASLESMEITADSNKVSLAGSINHIMEDPANMSWEDLHLIADFGPDINSMLAPYLAAAKLPGALQLSLMSSGSLNGFTINGEVESSQGSLEAVGNGSFIKNTLNGEVTVKGHRMDLGSFMNRQWLGRADFDLKAAGNIVGNKPELSFDGSIMKIEVSGQEINGINFNGDFIDKKGLLIAQIEDPDFTSKLQTEVVLNNQISVSASLELDDFQLGNLLDQDTALIVSGNFASQLSIAENSTSGMLAALQFSLENDSLNYLMDSLKVDWEISPARSLIDIHSDDINGSVAANFHIREGIDLMNEWRQHWGQPDGIGNLSKERQFNLALEVKNAAPFGFWSNSLLDFSGLTLSGEFEETNQMLGLKIKVGDLKGFHFSMDTLIADFTAYKNGITGALQGNTIYYDSTELGNLNFQIHHDSITRSNLLLTRDSSNVLNIASTLLPAIGGLVIHVDSLSSFDYDFDLAEANSILLDLKESNLFFNDFTVAQKDFKVSLQGNLNEFDLTLNNADLTALNQWFWPDSNHIHSGNLAMAVCYNNLQKQVNVQAEIDSLTFLNNPPIYVTASAISDGSTIPVLVNFKSSTNQVVLSGNYPIDNSEIDLLLDIDINDLNMFHFLVSEWFEQIDGKFEGQARITGTLLDPNYRGNFKFHDVEFTTLKPRSVFRLKDQVIALENASVAFNDFTVLDERQNPLVLNGVIKTKDYQSLEYDLSVVTDNYLLVNNPFETSYQLQGALVIGSNLKLRGTDGNTSIDAKITIQDSTNLTFVKPPENIELLSNEGIVEFVDPNEVTDSIQLSSAPTLYDSLVSTLPSFNLTSEITLKDQAVFRLIIDPRSGDLIQASGAANLKFELDRTGNTQLEGDYTISQGFYQLSFYDMVKKKFTIVPGSSLHWSGNPNNGDLDVKAVYNINSSSIGLIGHEIGENEKELYRKPLEYEVGIIIRGTTQDPEISFSLELPKSDLASYPALANKLDRLMQPENASELNKQVFGLLVLGGFIPESSGNDLDESLIASTALSNSVNSLLANQLNRFAGKLVKGVDINVGLQSYSDVSAGASQTRTVMDFRLTKRMLDDRLSIEVGGGVDLDSDQSGANTGSDNFRGDITVIYDLTESGSKQLKMFNNETYDIIYHEIRNTGVSIIFIKEFDKRDIE